MAGDGFPFLMHRQEQSHWCWAATAVSVSHFYDAASPHAQCILAEDEFGVADCCSDGSTPACDKPWYVFDALRRVGHSGRVEEGPASALEGEIAARRPVVTKIRWKDGTAHFPVISGYADVVVSLNPFVLERYLYVQDSSYGQSLIPYNTFRTAYQGVGQWTVTFYTT